MQRAELLAQLGAQRFDVLVIGGGIVGAGIARDAALRGLRVALIEQGDFASGTSSKTSKLIHGGLRYLEHGHLGLVRESLRERRILRRIAPALVTPLSLLLPVFQGDRRAPWMIQLGLWIYALLAWQDRLERYRMVSARQALKLEPALQPEGLRAAGLYADCQMDDARLCLVNILQAVEHGAVCCNYVRFRAFLKTDQRPCGAIGEDVRTGRAYAIQARVVVNATGPWADRIRRFSDAKCPERLAPTKGIHLVLPRAGLRHGLFIQGRRAAGRMLFVLPWGQQTLVGTTESPVGTSLEHLHASAEEVGYLLSEFNRVLPQARMREQDIVGTFAGARPLLGFSGSPQAASREHRLEIDRLGLVSVLGGKYTTSRRMAQQTVDVVVRRYRLAARRCQTARLPLVGGEMDAAEHALRAASALETPALGRLLIRYGPRARELLRLLEEDYSLAQPVCAHHDVLQVELAHALRGELACSITDVLARRTRIVWSACHGLEALPRLAELCQRYGGMGSEEVARQRQEYERCIAESLSFRSE